MKENNKTLKETYQRGTLIRLTNSRRAEAMGIPNGCLGRITDVSDAFGSFRVIWEDDRPIWDDREKITWFYVKDDDFEVVTDWDDPSDYQAIWDYIKKYGEIF